MCKCGKGENRMVGTAITILKIRKEHMKTKPSCFGRGCPPVSYALLFFLGELK
jgi:hypothetical protein